jgi:hypothetical protein
MPLPLIPILIGVGAGIIGAGKGIKAATDNSKAKDVNTAANNTVNNAKKLLEECRQKCNTSLESLGGKKLFVLDKSILRFVEAFEKLQNVEIEDSTGINELNKFRLDKQSFDALKEMGGYAASILGGTAAGAMGGALAAFGAYSGVMAFGAASTGTAIASLSGIAATNATLAFLGGGSLAAGGLGVAGGTMVLGGLVAGPALLIMGFIIGAKASANLNNAYSNLAEAQKTAQELNTASILCNSIRRRSYMFERLLIRLDAVFFPLVFGMENIISEKGVDWRIFQPNEKHTVAAAASIAKAIKTVLDTPILTEDGKLTDESEQIALEMKSFIDQPAGSTDKMT